MKEQITTIATKINKMTRLNLFFTFLLTVFIIMGCSGQKELVSPTPQYNTALIPLPVSKLNIPVNLKLAVLETIINSQLTGLLYEDKDFKDGDRMKVKVYKRNPIRLNGKENEIRYKIMKTINHELIL